MFLRRMAELGSRERRPEVRPVLSHTSSPFRCSHFQAGSSGADRATDAWWRTADAPCRREGIGGASVDHGWPAGCATLTTNRRPAVDAPEFVTTLENPVRLVSSAEAVPRYSLVPVRFVLRLARYQNLPEYRVDKEERPLEICAVSGYRHWSAIQGKEREPLTRAVIQSEALDPLTFTAA